MAGRRKAPARAARRAIARRKAQAVRTLGRLEGELPPTLKQFSQRVRRGLESLERRIDRAEARSRREIARLLREASHQLGRFEAEGDRRWRRLTVRARRDALRILHRIERVLEGTARKAVPPKRKAIRRARPRTAPRPAAVAAGSGI